jgi:hypothetical protein
METKDKIKIYEKAKRIFSSEELTWHEKYDLIFSEEISKNFDFEYYDPDISYQEDVVAYMNALDEYMNKYIILNKIEKELENE